MRENSEYTITSGIWGCDLVSSSELCDKDKSKYVVLIMEIIRDVLENTSIQILGYQFRGDGYLIALDAKNAQKSVVVFAKQFSEEVNHLVEQHKVKSDFRLRTYADFIEIGVTEEDEEKVLMTGAKVNEFCRLMDNKSSDPYILAKSFSNVLIISQKLFNLNPELIEDRFKGFIFNNTEYMKKEYKIRNFAFRVYNSNNQILNFNDELFILAKKHNLKQIIANKMYVIENSDDLNDIYSFFREINLKLLKYSKVKNTKSIRTLIDIEYGDAFYGDEDIISHIDFEESTNIEKSNKLIWTDAALDEFRLLSKFSADAKEYTKFTVNESLRVYYLSGRYKLPSKKIVKYSSIKETCIYLHSFDYTVQSSLRYLGDNIDLKKHLVQQLEIGLLLADHVIFHSAEILRNDIVYDIIEEYQDHLVTGSIRLLFSSKVNNIERDFYKYLQEKTKEYGKSKYGLEDAISIHDALESENYGRNLSMVSSVPILVKRDIEGTNTLEELLDSDLHASYEVIYKKESELFEPNILTENYTLKQLLSLKVIRDDKVFEMLHNNVQYEIIDLIDRHTSGVISSGIIISILKSKIDEDLQNRYKYWFISLLNRVNFIYGMVNTGDNVYMDFFPIRLKNSIFYASEFYNYFSDYVSVNGLIGSDAISKIRKDKTRWKRFRYQYANINYLKKEMSSCGLKNYRVSDNVNRDIRNVVKTIIGDKNV